MRHTTPCAFDLQLGVMGTVLSFQRRPWPFLCTSVPCTVGVQGVDLPNCPTGTPLAYPLAPYPTAQGSGAGGGAVTGTGGGAGGGGVGGGVAVQRPRLCPFEEPCPPQSKGHTVTGNQGQSPERQGHQGQAQEGQGQQEQNSQGGHWAKGNPGLSFEMRVAAITFYRLPEGDTTALGAAGRMTTFSCLPMTLGQVRSLFKRTSMFPVLPHRSWGFPSMCILSKYLTAKTRVTSPGNFKAPLCRFSKGSSGLPILILPPLRLCRLSFPAALQIEILGMPMAPFQEAQTELLSLLPQSGGPTHDPGEDQSKAGESTAMASGEGKGGAENSQEESQDRNLGPGQGAEPTAGPTAVPDLLTFSPVLPAGAEEEALEGHPGTRAKPSTGTPAAPLVDLLSLDDSQGESGSTHAQGHRASSTEDPFGLFQDRSSGDLLDLSAEPGGLGTPSGARPPGESEARARGVHRQAQAQAPGAGIVDLLSFDSDNGTGGGSVSVPQPQGNASMGGVSGSTRGVPEGTVLRHGEREMEGNGPGWHPLAEVGYTNSEEEGRTSYNQDDKHSLRNGPTSSASQGHTSSEDLSASHSHRGRGDPGVARALERGGMPKVHSSPFPFEDSVRSPVGGQEGLERRRALLPSSESASELFGNTEGTLGGGMANTNSNSNSNSDSRRDNGSGSSYWRASEDGAVEGREGQGGEREGPGEAAYRRLLLGVVAKSGDIKLPRGSAGKQHPPQVSQAEIPAFIEQKTLSSTQPSVLPISVLFFSPLLHH